MVPELFCFTTFIFWTDLGPPSLLPCFLFCHRLERERVYRNRQLCGTAHRLFSLYVYSLFITVPSENYGYTVLFETVPLAVVCLLVWLLLTRKRTLRMRRREMRFLPLAGIMIASCIVFSSLSSTARSEEALFMSQIVGSGYAIICCVLILVLLFGFTRENELEQDKLTMEILLHAEQEQHRINRETIDIINIKCHDLKHLLSGLREMDQKPERDEALAEIQQAVQFYDSNIRTGNDTLDLILTQKSFLCYNKKIALECFIDGTCMVFMKSSDLLSLFGNILDNAIESVQNFPTENGRSHCASVNATVQFLFMPKILAESCASATDCRRRRRRTRPTTASASAPSATSLKSTEERCRCTRKAESSMSISFFIAAPGMESRRQGLCRAATHSFRTKNDQIHKFSDRMHQVRAVRPFFLL